MKINKNNLIRGSIWYVDLNPVIGREQANIRPCIIISVNKFNFGPADLIVVLPITSKYRDLWWFVEINKEVGLKNRSYIICNQLRTISIERISGKNIGIVDNSVLEQVDQRIKILLNI